MAHRKGSEKTWTQPIIAIIVGWIRGKFKLHCGGSAYYIINNIACVNRVGRLKRVIFNSHLIRAKSCIV